jgi:hypothetical protein
MNFITYIDNLILESKSSKFKIGDVVKYAVKFLRSTGQYDANTGKARGKITDIKKFYEGKYLISIDWDNKELPNKVLETNLSLASDPEHSSY